MAKRRRSRSELGWLDELSEGDMGPRAKRVRWGRVALVAGVLIGGYLLLRRRSSVTPALAPQMGAGIAQALGPGMTIGAAFGAPRS